MEVHLWLVDTTFLGPVSARWGKRVGEVSCWAVGLVLWLGIQTYLLPWNALGGLG